MPHPVGGAMGVTLSGADMAKGIHPVQLRLFIRYFNPSRWDCVTRTLTSTADICLLGKASSQLFYSSS